MAETQLKTIEMPAVADTGVVDNMREEMLDALNAGSLEIELSNVERVSTSALFMLLSAGVAAKQHDYELRLSAPSEHFSSAVSTLGLDDAFEPYMKG